MRAGRRLAVGQPAYNSVGCLRLASRGKRRIPAAQAVGPIEDALVGLAKKRLLHPETAVSPSRPATCRVAVAVEPDVVRPAESPAGCRSATFSHRTLPTPVGDVPGPH